MTEYVGKQVAYITQIIFTQGREHKWLKTMLSLTVSSIYFK